MMIRILALALVLSSPALAQSYNRGNAVRGLCQPDGCDEFAIVAADRIAATEEGTLFKTRLRTFHASGAGRQDLGEENGYVYCSPTKPAIMADQDGRTMAYFLAPFSTSDSRETIRRNSNYHAVYFTICHGAEAGRAAVRDLSTTAQDLGYRVPLAQSRTAALNRPEDVMAGASQPVEARRDERLMPHRELPREAPYAGTSRDAFAGDDADEYAGDYRPVPPRPVPAPPAAAPRDEGLLAAPRRLTNRALDALDEVGGWMFGR
jgi:hypothetical protein